MGLFPSFSSNWVEQGGKTSAPSQCVCPFQNNCWLVSVPQTVKMQSVQSWVEASLPRKHHNKHGDHWQQQQLFLRSVQLDVEIIIPAFTSSSVYCVPSSLTLCPCPAVLPDCAVNVHKSCKSLLGECTSSRSKVNTPHQASSSACSTFVLHQTQ